MNLKELFLNTPRKYWIVVKGYHIHGLFFGLMFTFLDIFFIWFIVVGIILVIHDIAGHIYTKHRPIICLIDKIKE